MTVKEYLNSSEKKKNVYRFMRSRLMVLGIVPFLLFFILYRFPRKSAEFSKKERLTSYITDLILFSIILIMGYSIGFINFLIIQMPLNLLVGTIATWMFFIQHQYEHSYWEKEKNIDFYTACLQGSSFFKLPAVFNWFTGNTGYHHIHHLSPLIPHYLLQKCHNENPHFHNVPTITFLDSFKTFKYALWDEEKKKMVTFSQAGM